MTKDRNKIIDTIVANITDVDKPAIETFTGEVLTYGALVKFIELTQATLEQFNIKPHQRIGFISDNPLTFPVLLGIIETATFAALNSTWNTEKYLEYFDLLSIDYVMTDIGSGAAIDAARSRGIGVIQFQVLPPQRSVLNLRLSPVCLPTNPSKTILPLLSTQPRARPAPLKWCQEFMKIFGSTSGILVWI